MIVSPSDDKAMGDVLNKQNAFIAIVAVALVAVTFYFQSSMKNIDNKMNMLLSRSMSQPSTGQGGRQRDPYLESAVHNTILKRAVDIQKAYNVYLARHPKISDGNIKLDWQIGQDGRTISPEVVTSDFHDKKFDDAAKSRHSGLDPESNSCQTIGFTGFRLSPE